MKRNDGQKSKQFSWDSICQATHAKHNPSTKRVQKQQPLHPPSISMRYDYFFLDTNRRASQ